jgi:hypothetical protein
MTKSEDDETEIDLLQMRAELVCGDLLSGRIYYDKPLEKHTHFSYVLEK